jgi:hypothetical protein
MGEAACADKGNINNPAAVIHFFTSVILSPFYLRQTYARAGRSAMLLPFTNAMLIVTS